MICIHEILCSISFDDLDDSFGSTDLGENRTFRLRASRSKLKRKLKRSSCGGPMLSPSPMRAMSPVLSPSVKLL